MRHSGSFSCYFLMKRAMRLNLQRCLYVLTLGVLVTIGLAGCQSRKGSGKASDNNDSPPKGGVTLRPFTSDSATVQGKFTQLTAESTGIDFANELLPQNMRKYLLNGAGLATGDFDGDGFVDLYAISQDGPNRLFRQTAPWKFEDVTDSAGDLSGGNLRGTGAAFIDIENDGDLDLYVCNIDGANLLYVNQGDGTFREEAKGRGVEYTGASTMCSFADYDRDGDLDLYLVNNRVFSILEEQPNVKIRTVGGVNTVHPDFVEEYFLLEGRVQEAGQRDLLFRNDGSGNFSDVTEESGIAGYDMGLSATWWDYDGDGWMDLYVANDLKSPDHLYRNLGKGKFQDVIAETVGHTPWFSMGADAADINNDGMMDFLVADMSSTTHYKQKTTMGEMGNSAWFLTIGRPRQFMRNTLYLNSGSERMFEAANLTGLDSTDWSWSIKFGDFDSDSLIDVFVTNGVGKNMNDSDAAARFKELLKEGRKDEATEQLLKMPPLNEENLAFRNMANLAFQNVASQWGINHLGVSQGASVVDIDRDGDLDLLVNNMNEPLGIYRNDIGNGNDLLVELRGTVSNRYGLNARITVVTGGTRMIRYLNSARGFMSADEPVVHFGLGTHTSIDEILVEWPSGMAQRFTNISANQIVTITEGTEGKYEPAAAPKSTSWMKEASDTGLTHHHHELEYDDFRDQPLLPNKLSQLGPGLAWGDVNGDGLQDCYAGAATGSAPQLFLQSSEGKFTPSQKFADDRSFEDMGALFFDLESDGDLDLYVVSGGYEREIDSEYLQDRLYLNDGNGQFTRAPKGTIPDLRVSGSGISAADFDRDGDLDVFVGTRLTPKQWPMPASSYLLENRDGKLVDVSAEVASPLSDIGLVTGSTWSDVDQDGWVDLLVSLEWGPIRLLKNNQGKLEDHTEAAGLATQVGWWNSVSGGDIDNDGDMDFVAMNVGLNTKYHGDDKHPVVLFAADFDENGRLDLVEAEYEGDVCYPIRGRSCSSHAMPFLKEKFPTYHEFALADVGEIYSDESLEQSTKFSANQLRSMVLINDGKGHFRMTPFAKLVQISPGFGTALQDFDGDGNLDLCIAQNFMQPQPETGQMDGSMGMMLKGDGQGGFTVMLPGQSGILAEGQGMALTVTDLNRDSAPDLMMSLNDDASKIWLNQSKTNRKRFTVTLDAGSGNRNGVGSYLLARTRSGKVQAHEIAAGSGYLSQSSPEIFLASDTNDPVLEVQVRWPDGTSQTTPINEISNLKIEKQAAVSAGR